MADPGLRSVGAWVPKSETGEAPGSCQDTWEAVGEAMDLRVQDVLDFGQGVLVGEF